ncbi:AraC family transcriptional regulator [Kordiimonas pumila]|uniref:Helix-turn-helix domain-containing protein n=1 Tax=Kordiimonas pumila TaxID=2161677 RepID=A0ABV7D517_9PROT|nr:AraC family transcriptional regulator [Kordiimonas pumila]
MNIVSSRILHLPCRADSILEIMVSIADTDKSVSLLRSIPLLQETLQAVQAAPKKCVKADNGNYEKIPGCNGFKHLYDPDTAEGGIEFYELQDGLWLILVDTKTKQVMTSRHSLGGKLVLTAVLQANIDISDLENTRDGSLANGHCMIYGMETDGSFETVYAPRRTLKWVSVIIDPSRFFPCTRLDARDIPAAFLNFLENGIPIAHRNIPMTREESQTTLQMIDCTLKGSYRSVFLQSKALELLCLVLSGFKEIQTRQPGIVLTAKDYARIERAKKYIQDSFSDRPNIEELAFAVDLTRHKLQFGFKQLYGDTVAHVREKMRLEYALKLIRSSEMSMIEIALETGYEHQASFARAFKAAYGISPMEARRTTGKTLR